MTRKSAHVGPQANEERALLDNTDASGGGDAEWQREGVAATVTCKATPLPMRQIGVMVVSRFSEPISFSVIFPFVNQMVFDIGATDDKAKVGYYAGVIESLFAVAQACTVIYWGSLSDRIGRKPVLVSGLIGVVCSTLLFGLSRTFFCAVFARALAGGTNGNIAVVKSMMAELTDSTNQARAFTFFPVTWTLGCFVGPLIGGYLSNPVDKYPSTFGPGGSLYFDGFWQRFPYFLPCLVSATMTLGSIILTILCLEETLPSIVEARRAKAPAALVRASGYGATSEGIASVRSAERSVPDTKRSASGSVVAKQHLVSGSTPTETRVGSGEASCETSSRPGGGSRGGPAQASLGSLLRVPQIREVIISYMLLTLIAVALDAVLVLYLFEPVELGGLGFSTDAIGVLLSIGGLGGAALQLFFFPPLQRRLGTFRIYQLAMWAYPLAVLLMPLANVVARASFGSATPSPIWTALLWACLLLHTAAKVFGGMAFSANMLLINQCATLTSATGLGTLNSLAQMAACTTRALGPYAANVLFAVSVTHNLLGGQFVWLVLTLIGAFAAISCSRIYDMEK